MVAVVNCGASVSLSQTMPLHLKLLSSADHAIDRVRMGGHCAARKVLLAVVLTWLSSPCHDLALPKNLPEHYQKPLDLIFRGRNVGDLTRIQLLDHKYNIEFIAIVAATFLRKNPQGRCAILVINQRVALATVEKLQEYGVSAQYCSARNPVDPSHSVAVCGGIHVRRALRGQSFDIKVVGHDILTLKEVRARSEVQVAPSFNLIDVEVDYRYSWEQAYIDGRVAALDALVMPLVCWKNSTLQRQVDAVTDLLLLRIADWAPTAVVFHQKNTAKCCISKLQSLGISAQFWPKQLPENHKTKESRLRLHDLRRKVSQSELQVIGCTRGAARYLPDGVRSIIDVTSSPHSARGIAGGIFETLRKLGNSSRCVYVDVCCYWQSLRYQVRHAAMSLPFWQEVVSDQFTLDEISSMLGTQSGVSLSLLKPNGEIVEATEDNLEEIILKQRQNQKRCQITEIT